MADRRRIVSISTSGTVATVLDLENGSTYQAVKDSFVVTPGARKTTMANQPRRYAGARPVAETHDNGTVEWKMLVSGATVTTAIANVEALLTLVEDLDGLFLEWRPDGATSSVYYELRGSPTWKPSYSWAQMQGAGSMYVDLSFPVAPLAWGDKISISTSRPSGGSPAYYALTPTIPGDAPALADVSMTPVVSPGAKWGLLAWMTRPAAPSGGVTPFGVLEGEAATLTTFASTVDAAQRNGSYAALTTSGAGTAAAQWAIDPTVLPADAFRTDTTDVELWAVVSFSAATLQGLTLAASFWNSFPTTNPKQYTREYGSVGKTITPQVGRMIVRLGVLTTWATSTSSPVLRIDAAWTGVSAGSVTWGIDYLVTVPARQRACSPTAKANDSSYPTFAPAAASTTVKKVYSDLSSSAINPSGLGGSPIEFPPGDVDLLVWISSGIPDTSLEALQASPITLSLVVTPRYWLAKGT